MLPDWIPKFYLLPNGFINNGQTNWCPLEANVILRSQIEFYMQGLLEKWQYRSVTVCHLLVLKFTLGHYAKEQCFVFRRALRQAWKSGKFIVRVRTKWEMKLILTFSVAFKEEKMLLFLWWQQMQSQRTDWIK